MAPPGPLLAAPRLASHNGMWGPRTNCLQVRHDPTGARDPKLVVNGLGSAD